MGLDGRAGFDGELNSSPMMIPDFIIFELNPANKKSRKLVIIEQDRKVDHENIKKPKLYAQILWTPTRPV